MNLFDILWPRTCEICGKTVDRPDRQICSDCLMRLPFIPETGNCRVCGRAIDGQPGEFLCDDCIAHPPAFDRAASVFRFEGALRRMILDFKFNQHLWMRDDFVDFLAASAAVRFDAPAIDAVLPLPTTVWHRFVRGFNLPSLLAASLARRIDRRFEPFALYRRRFPKRQGGLKEEERRTNVVGTIGVARPDRVRGRTLLVVDDIMTTGSTLSECARVLKEAGASRVWCLTLARSLHT